MYTIQRLLGLELWCVFGHSRYLKLDITRPHMFVLDKAPLNIVDGVLFLVSVFKGIPKSNVYFVGSKVKSVIMEFSL